MERIYYRDQVLETIARKVLCAYDTILFYGDPQPIPVEEIIESYRTCGVRFSVLWRSITGFLEVGVWNRFIGFWVNAVGFSTALLLDFHQSGVLQFPQGVHRFLPPTVKQVNHLADGVIQENPSAVIRPPILAG